MASGAEGREVRDLLAAAPLVGQMVNLSRRLDPALFAEPTPFLEGSEAKLSPVTSLEVLLIGKRSKSLPLSVEALDRNRSERGELRTPGLLLNRYAYTSDTAL